MGKGSIFFFVILLALVFLVVFRDGAVDFGIESSLSKTLGLPVKVDSVHLGLRSSSLSIQGLKIYNPRGFHDTLFLSFPEIFVDFSVREILSTRKWGFKKAILDVSRINIVKNESGKVNLGALNRELKTPLPIEHVELSIEKATYLDMGLEVGQDSKDYEIGVDHLVLEEIQSPSDILNAIIFKTTQKLSVEEFGIDLPRLSQEVAESLKQPS